MDIVYGEDFPICYIPDFIGTRKDLAFSLLQNELDWVRVGTTPRYEYYVNEFNTPYTYGVKDFARTYNPQPPHPVITTTQWKLEEITNSKFEVCFLNRYKDQSDHLGWHADDSPEMDDNRPIGIVSLGVEREIWFRVKADKEKILKLRLGHGSLCLMAPGMQDTHDHRIPKSDRMCGERISLTFRGYVSGIV
jgi:alkylated DNA repair dioxygenase AlkB